MLLPTKVLAAISENLDGYGDSAEFHITHREVSISAKNDVTEVKVLIAEKGDEEMGILCREEHRDKFKIKYFLKMAKAAKLVCMIFFDFFRFFSSYLVLLLVSLCLFVR